MSWDEGRNETTAVTIAHEQFNIVQSPQAGFVDGRRACVRVGRAGHLPRRQVGVVRRDGVGGRDVDCSSPDTQEVPRFGDCRLCGIVWARVRQRKHTGLIGERQFFTVMAEPLAGTLEMF